MDDDPIQLRFLNDFLYCPRRCALHRIEGVWQANAYTVSGELAHQTADDPGYRQTLDAAGGVLRVERALLLFCRKLNLVRQGRHCRVSCRPGRRAGHSDAR